MRSLRLAASWQRGLPPPGTEPTTQVWRFEAACGQDDPDLFFPVGVGEAARRQARQAKAVCRGCPVKLACLTWAMETEQTDGIWGGLDGLERQRLGRQQVNPPCQ